MSEGGLKMKYFVLKPEGNDEYAKASRKAMFVYASSIQLFNPELADDLFKWHDKCKQEAENE
jgi:hypothetical protein